jgi:hypothetical protein
MGRHFTDYKSSAIFQVFPCTTQIALFWPKLLPALFLKKPCYLCPFEILAEALDASMDSQQKNLHSSTLFQTICALEHNVGRNQRSWEYLQEDGGL